MKKLSLILVLCFITFSFKAMSQIPEDFQGSYSVKFAYSLYDLVEELDRALSDFAADYNAKAQAERVSLDRVDYNVNKTDMSPGQFAVSRLDLKTDNTPAFQPQGITLIGEGDMETKVRNLRKTM